MAVTFYVYSSLNEYVGTNRNNFFVVYDNFLGDMHALPALHVFIIQ